MAIDFQPSLSFNSGLKRMLEMAIKMNVRDGYRNFNMNCPFENNK